MIRTCDYWVRSTQRVRVLEVQVEPDADQDAFADITLGTDDQLDIDCRGSFHINDGLSVKIVKQWTSISPFQCFTSVVSFELTMKGTKKTQIVRATTVYMPIYEW